MSSTRSTHSATSVCLSSRAGGGVVRPPEAWFETSTEMTTSSTMTGMASSGLVHGEVLVIQLQRLDHDRVVAGAKVGHGPPRRVGADEVPGPERRVGLVEQLDVHALGLD